MVQYATIDDYAELFPVNLSETDLKRKLMLASEKIDEKTYNRIPGIGFANLTPFQQEKVKLAVCYQAEYLIEKEATGEDADISSYSVLDISVTLDKGQNDAIKRVEKAHGMSYEAYDFIKKTGLTNRSFRGWR